ncbi:MerR family transcriptional regulator [Novosphingobium sp. AP12]|uniref:MerR family transcriptional regulator n=1 Tax=Novosphingobium sp. AP12 TaxID=1144305 RepID=UPI000271EC79|nr:MerR family transcriptional regulator [Novosphingobium sp. AP12]EJL29001.1 putative transcriptional regulator [Novosphingobium sp. AP12]
MTISDIQNDTNVTGGGSLLDGAAVSVFADGKDPGALRTIGEVAKALGIRPHVLRYWEEQFAALAPIKRSGSRRYYRPEDVVLIAQIDRLVHHQGYTLRGAAKVIEDKLQGSASIGQAPSEELVNSPQDDFFARLAQVRDELAAGLAAA